MAITRWQTPTSSLNSDEIRMTRLALRGELLR